MKVRRIAATEEMRKTCVAAYCRVSTNKAEQEDSLEVQQSTYVRYIHQNPDWEYAGVYVDASSGLCAEKRDGFLQMIDDAMAGKINLILCKSVSRFSRNIVECQRYTEMLRGKNVTVIFEKEHIRTDVPTSNLIFSLMCAIAQDESRSISENIRTANQHRVEAGVFIPRDNQMLGYGVNMGKLVPNEDAGIVLYVFNRYAEGAGMLDICRELNGQGLCRMRVEKPFTHQIIRHMLENESYVGDKALQKHAPKNFLTKRPDASIPYKTNYLTDSHEGIVSRELWNTVQNRLKGEAALRKEGLHRYGKSHELYGRVICGNCGQPYMRRMIRKRNVSQDASPHVYYWYCRGKNSKDGCKNPGIREDRLEEAMKGKNRAVINCVGTVVELP